MTKDEIFLNIIFLLAGAFISPVFNAFMPSRDKIRSYTKKVIHVAFSYLLPLGILVEIYFDNTPVDKTLIFKIILFTGLLILNITLDLFGILSSKIQLHKEDVIESFKHVIQQFAKLHDLQIDSSKEIMELNRHVNDKTLDLISALNAKIEELEKPDVEK